MLKAIPLHQFFLFGQKGLVLVFQNGPLEPIKAPLTLRLRTFVHEYLQKTIGMQIRMLMMEELPAISHWLSLRMCCPGYRSKEEEVTGAPVPPPPGQRKQQKRDYSVDPFASLT
jgi:mitochondrial distribution and morphology protein 34